MTSTQAETTFDPAADDTGKHAGENEIEVLVDLDDLAGTATMLGCGDDNPYR
jgi:hypothetical protein